MIAGDWKPHTTAQWFKLALIPALGVGLLVVLWQQPKAQTAETTTLSVQGQGEASPRDASTVAETVPPRPIWPKARLEDLIAFNPFDAKQAHGLEPAPQSEHEVNERSATHTGDKSRSRPVTSGEVQAIFVDAHGSAAVLDFGIVRVGDVLPSGDRVVEITREGIKLERF